MFTYRIKFGRNKYSVNKRAKAKKKKKEKCNLVQQYKNKYIRKAVKSKEAPSKKQIINMIFYLKIILANITITMRSSFTTKN